MHSSQLESPTTSLAKQSALAADLVTDGPDSQALTNAARDTFEIIADAAALAAATDAGRQATGSQSADYDGSGYLRNLPLLDGGGIPSQADLMAALEMVRSLLSESAVRSAETAIKHNEERQKAASDQRIAKLQKAAEAVAKAQTDTDAGKVFAWIAVGLSILGSGVALVFSLGSAAPVVTLAVTGLVLALVSTGTMIWMEADQEGMMKVFGDSEQDKKNAKIFWMVFMITCSITSAICTGGASYAASAASLSTKIATLSKLLAGASSIGGGIASGISGGFNIAAAQARFTGGEARATAEKIASWIQRRQNSTEAAIEEIKELLATMSDLATLVARAIADESLTKNNIARKMIQNG